MVTSSDEKMRDSRKVRNRLFSMRRDSGLCGVRCALHSREGKSVADKNQHDSSRVKRGFQSVVRLKAIEKAMGFSL